MSTTPPPEEASSGTDDTASSPQALEQQDVAPSTASLDSETILLNPQPDHTEEDTASSRPAPQRSNTDLKQCWICYVDETEDTPTTSRWRSPCPCALVAHEACLLDWVADLESPASRRTRTAPAKIQCPQCKKDIVIARPRSHVVDITKAMERLGARLVVPGMVLALGGSVYTGATMHGIVSVYMVFGKKDFERMLGGPTISPKWLATFPLIPVTLLLSRTTFSDQIYPTLPILLYASGILQTWGSLNRPQLWPPTPELAFSALPLVRSVYRTIRSALFAKKEKEWLRSVEPRAGEGRDDGANPADVPGDDAGLDFFNIQIEDTDDEAEVVVEAAVQVEVNEAGDIPAANPGNGNAAPVEGQENNAEQARPRPRPQGRTISGTYIAGIFMEALIFPVVASAMGQLLKYALPKGWTTPPTYIFKLGLAGKQSFTSASRTPFLGSKWARSIVGGCLFVVMKDTFQLYTKYRIAKDHQKRRVCNWDKKLGRIVD